jgi:hypothetical protein
MIRSIEVPQCIAFEMIDKDRNEWKQIRWGRTEFPPQLLTQIIALGRDIIK